MPASAASRVFNQRKQELMPQGHKQDAVIITLWGVLPVLWTVKDWGALAEFGGLSPLVGLFFTSVFRLVCFPSMYMSHLLSFVVQVTDQSLWSWMNYRNIRLPWLEFHPDPNTNLNSHRSPKPTQEVRTSASLEVKCPINLLFLSTGQKWP